MTDTAEIKALLDQIDAAKLDNLKLRSELSDPTPTCIAKKRIGILGAGAIGSLVGGLLAKIGHDVTLIDPWFEHIAAIQERGLLIKNPPESEKGDVLTHPTAVHFKDLSSIDELFDMGFIAVNSYDTDWAAVCLNRYVKPEGILCCFQNAINDNKIAAVAGADRTLGVVVTISAGVYDPGIALRTDLNPHCFKVGELDGKDTPRAQELADMLSKAIDGPTCVTTNLMGVRWSKLIVNCMNNGLAGLTGWMTAYTRTHLDTQRIGIQLAAEVVLVARAYGEHVEGVMGMNPDDVVGAAAGNPEMLAKVCGERGESHCPSNLIRPPHCLRASSSSARPSLSRWPV
jgi:2-dehydropantoate 2-reductase